MNRTPEPVAGAQRRRGRGWDDPDVPLETDLNASLANAVCGLRGQRALQMRSAQSDSLRPGRCTARAIGRLRGGASRSADTADVSADREGGGRRRRGRWAGFLGDVDVTR